MRPVPRRHVSCPSGRFLKAARPALLQRGAAVLRAELSAAQTPLDEHVDSAEAASPSGDDAHEISAQPQTAATHAVPGEPRKAARKQRPLLNPSDFRCKVGDVVVGKVVYASDKGARVDLVDHPGVMGFMPVNRAPYAMRAILPRVADDPEPRPFSIEDANISVGTTRRFLIVAIPPDLEVNGKGPLLACNNVDLALMWRRLEQIYDACVLQREVVNVLVHGASAAGLLCSLTGLRGFIPASHISKPPDGSWWEQESLEAAFVGKQVPVALMKVFPEKNTFTCSMRIATEHRAVKRLHIGSLVWGTVRLIKDYGAFVALDDTNESALLHVSNFSWERVYSIDDHVQTGERIRAVIIGMDNDFTRISVSTRDIEAVPGDMLRDKEAVYANAEESVKPFLQHVKEWEAEQAAKQEQDWQDSTPDAMEADDFRK